MLEKSFWFTVYVLCILAPILQIYPLLRSGFTIPTTLTKFRFRSYMSPTKASSRKEEVAMKDFPLLAKVCVRPGFDMLALRKAGYNSTDSYFTGKSKFNSSVIGWAGHTQDGNREAGSI